MTTKLTDSFINDFKNELNNRINSSELLIQFFTGVQPTREEMNTFLNGNRISDKLGEVSVTLVNGEFDSVIDGVDPISFTPDVSGECTWCTVAPKDSLNEIVILNDMSNHIVIQDYNLDTTIENNLQKLFIKI